MNLHYTDRAKQELDSAFEWYESRRRGLGFAFLDCIEDALSRLLSFPELYAVCYANFRRCVIKRFPFSIFYTLEGDTIVIHAIFDNRQHPRNFPDSN